MFRIIIHEPVTQLNSHHCLYFAYLLWKLTAALTIRLFFAKMMDVSSKKDTPEQRIE